MVANVLFMNLLVPIRSPKKSPRLELRCKSPNLCTGMLNGALTVNFLNKNLSDDPSRYSCRTKPDCLRHRSSLLGCRFGSSGSSRLVGRFLDFQLSNCEPVLKARRNPDQCRYRYTCRPSGFPVRGGCRPKRIQWHFRGRMKLLRFSDNLTTLLGFNPVYACQEI